jgi:hypothetical protein
MPDMQTDVFDPIYPDRFSVFYVCRTAYDCIVCSDPWVYVRHIIT